MWVALAYGGANFMFVRLGKCLYEEDVNAFFAWLELDGAARRKEARRAAKESPRMGASAVTHQSPGQPDEGGS